jgi:hypothetical protein
MSDYQLTYSSSSLLTSVNMLFIKHFATFAIFLLFGSAVLAIPQGPKKGESGVPHPSGLNKKERKRIKSGNSAASKLTIAGVIRLFPEEWDHRVRNHLCHCCGEGGHKAMNCPLYPDGCLGPKAPGNKPGPSTENNPSSSTGHNPSPVTE